MAGEGHKINENEYTSDHEQEETDHPTRCSIHQPSVVDRSGIKVKPLQIVGHTPQGKGQHQLVEGNTEEESLPRLSHPRKSTGNQSRPLICAITLW